MIPPEEPILLIYSATQGSKSNIGGANRNKWQVVVVVKRGGRQCFTKH